MFYLPYKWLFNYKMLILKSGITYHFPNIIDACVHIDSCGEPFMSCSESAR